MADTFGLAIHVMDRDTNQPIQGAEITGEVAALDGADALVPCVTNDQGIGTIQAFYLTVTKDGYHAYVHQPYRRPALGVGAMPVHLQRR